MQTKKSSAFFDDDFPTTMYHQHQHQHQQKFTLSRTRTMTVGVPSTRRRAQNVVSPMRKRRWRRRRRTCAVDAKKVSEEDDADSLAAFLEKRTTKRGEQEEKVEDGNEDVLMTPREIIDNLPSILDLESDVPVVVDLVDFSTLCKQYVKRDGDVDELVKLFSESEYNSAKFLEGAFDVVYEARMAMRKNEEVSLEVYGAFQEICLACAKAFRKRHTKPEVFLANECIKEISQSRYKAKQFNDDEAIERARWRVRKALVESFVDRELYGNKEDFDRETTKKQTLLDFAKFARQLSICRSAALDDMEKNVSFATERMGMSESLIEGATQRALNKQDDLEITKNALDRVVRSVDEVLALCLELELEKKNNPETTRVMKAEQLLRKNRQFLDDTPP